MTRRLRLFNATSLALGFAFLYLPILLLVVYSFNASRLVTVWGGFSTQWYGALFRNEPLMERGLGHAAHRPRSRRRLATVLGTLAALALDALRPLPRPDPVHRHGLRADGDAGGDHRPVAAAVLRRASASTAASGRSMLAHTTFTMCFVTVVVQARLVDASTARSRRRRWTSARRPCAPSSR